MVGEFSELEDEQNGTVWVQKLSERLQWADPELADDMVSQDSPQVSSSTNKMCSLSKVSILDSRTILCEFTRKHHSAIVADHVHSRWLIPLLTHTLPLPAVFMIWDALFSRPMRERDQNPKLDYLMDICTSMLLCARATLLQ